MEYTIDALKINERKEAHEYLAEVFSFPEYYGKNLDALFDCLTEMGECSILFTNLDYLEQLGDYSGALLAVFEEAEQANENINLVYDMNDMEGFD